MSAGVFQKEFLVQLANCVVIGYLAVIVVSDFESVFPFGFCSVLVAMLKCLCIAGGCP